MHALNSIVPGRQAGRSPLPSAQDQNPVTGSASAEVPRTGNFGLGLVVFFFFFGALVQKVFWGAAVPVQLAAYVFFGWGDCVFKN